MLFCKSLSIDLVEPVVYLRGPKDKHTVNILRGVIRLQLTRPIHMESVTIQFIGISKTLWPEASQHWDKQVLVDSVIPICKTPMSLKKGTHAFPFEILLSNALSESIECGLGHVRYKLVCQVHTQPTWKTSFFMNSPLKAKQSVILVRLPPQDTPRCITQTHHITPHDQLNMVIETAHLTPGAMLPLSLHFSKPEHIQSLDTLTVKLIERQKFRAPSKQTTRILHHEITLQQPSSSAPPFYEGNETRFVYLIPDSRSLQVHPTTTNRIIRVRHWIQVALTLTLTNGETKDLWMDTPISVLLSSLDDYHTLPVYQPVSDHLASVQDPPSPSSSSFTTTTSIMGNNATNVAIPTILNHTNTNTSSNRIDNMIKGSLHHQKNFPSSFSVLTPPLASPSTLPSSSSSLSPQVPPLLQSSSVPLPVTLPSSSSLSSSSYSNNIKKKKKKPNTWITKLYARHKEIFWLPSSLLLPPPPPVSLSPSLSSSSPPPPPPSSSPSILSLPPIYQE